MTKNMLKVGVLITDFDKLKNWELRIIKTIIDDPELELSLLIKNGSQEKINSKKNKLWFRLIHFIKNGSKSLFSLQLKIEKKFIKDIALSDRNSVLKHLQNTPIIRLYPTTKDSIDVFNAFDNASIKKHHLDLILKHGFNKIQGEIFQSAKYGIWSFNIRESSLNNGGLLGFWEIVLNIPTIEVVLEQLTSDYKKIKIIDKAFFNKRNTFTSTNNNVLEASIPLLMKNIRQLKNGNYTIKESIREDKFADKTLNLFYFIKYLLKFSSHFIRRVVEKINIKLFKTRYDCWTLLIGKGNFMETSLKELKPLELPKDEFWADPFFFKHNNQHYIFFENFSYTSKLGKISCGRLENNKLIDICDVLSLDYHLSYPHIFEEDGEIFLMPETCNNKNLTIYKCVQFPSKWEIYSTAFEGEIVFDATFYNDDKNQKWLFINKMTDSTPFDSELYIYRVDSLKMNKLEPHEKNPVIINSETSRNGGSFFKYNNEVYRPSQYNADGIYGRGLNINKIKKLSLQDYDEVTIKRIMPDFFKGNNAAHHLHQTDEYFVIDAAYRKK